MLLASEDEEAAGHVFTGAMQHLSSSLAAGHIVKYADYPIVHSLGLANISIPLYTAKAGSLEVPVTISYHASGIKLNEISECAGLGWSLNAGGAVVKDICGAIDDNIYNHTVKTEEEADLEYLSAVLTQRSDAYWDKYHYSYPGGSGSFIVNLNESNEVIKTTWNDDKIEVEVKETPMGSIFTGVKKSVVSFTVTDAVGNRYEYTQQSGISIPLVFRQEKDSGKVDKISRRDIGTTTAWHLTKITSADLANTISFTYEKKGTYIEKVEDFPYYFHKNINASDSEPFLGEDSRTSSLAAQMRFLHAIEYDCMVLTEIYYNGNHIDFRYQDGPQPIAPELENVPTEYPSGYNLNPARRLWMMLVYNMNGDIVRKVFFDNSTSENDPKRFKLNALEFVGSDAAVYDRYVFDYYGVRGIVVGDESFQDAPSSRYAQDFFGYYNGKDNNIDLHFIAPTGSGNSRNYSFNHAIYNSLRSISRLSGSKTEFIYSPNLHHDAVVGDIAIGLRINTINTYDAGKLVKSRTFEYGDSGTTIDFRKLDVSDFMERRQLYFSDDHLEEYLIVYPYSILPGASVENAKVFYGKVTETVKDVVNDKSVQTEYIYDTGNWKCPYISKNYSLPPVSLPSEYWKFIKIQNYTNPGTAQEHYIGEIRGYFKNCPQSFGNVNQIIKKETMPDGSLRPVRKESYTYGQHYPAINQRITVGLYAKIMVTTERLGTPSWEYALGEVNHMRTAKDCFYFDVIETPVLSIPQSRAVTNYYGDVQHTETMNMYYYAPNKYKAWPNVIDENSGPFGWSTLPCTITVNSDGKEYKKRMLYPKDYKPEPYQSMKEKNMLYVGVGEETIKNGVDTIATYKDYQKYEKIIGTDTVDYYKPSKEMEYLNGEILSQKEVKEYDSYGNPAYIVESGQPDVCYIWSYRGTYPVAEIRGATYEEVKTALGRNVALADIERAVTHTVFIDKLNNLRRSLPEALITTYTYKPLVGMTTTTDAAGRMKTFYYDGVGRLKAVKDEKGNLLETYEYGKKSIRYEAAN